MRILHIIPQFAYFGGNTVVGGHASCLMTLALGQTASTDDVTILSYTGEHNSRRRIADGLSLESLVVSAKTRTFQFGLQFCRSVLTWLQPRKSRFDVVHVHSGYADYFMLSGQIKSNFGMPVIHTMYCPIPLRGGRWRIPGVHGLIRKWANSIDVNVGISNNVRSSMATFGVPTPICIRPGVSISRFSGATCRKSVRRDLDIEDEDLVILFVGNASPQKNALGVLKAFDLLRREFVNVKLVITTELKHSSSDSELASLARAAETLGIGPYIRQQGIVNNMPDLMQAADVLVAPFLDTYGPSDYFMAALEAMACGKPVVVSNVGGMPEVVSADTGRLVNPRDHTSIAEGLRDFLIDKSLRINSGANARRFVQQHLNPIRMVEEYRLEYERIVA